MFAVFLTKSMIPFEGSKNPIEFFVCLFPHPTPPPNTRRSPFISVSLHFAAFSSMAKIGRVVLIKAKYCEGF